MAVPAPGWAVRLLHAGAGHDAFARLRAHAFTPGVSLGDVARDVAARRLHFTKDT